MLIEMTFALACMSKALYFEARSESMVGMLAVGQVIMNRVEDKRFPNTVCGVVTDGLRYKNSGRMVKHKCAFSFYCDGKPETIHNREAYKQSEQLALSILKGTTLDVTEGATHYHARYTKPYWASAYKRTTCIDTHCFYRWENKK